MTQYPCPICHKRVCDSEKDLFLEKFSNTNTEKADIIIKCQNCKNIVAIEVNQASCSLITEASVH